MNSEPHQWKPGNGPSAEALERMRVHFPKPTEPMGVAWFMDEKRKLYTELMIQPLSELPVSYLENVFWDITSGTSSFGHLKEWDDWFRYLLPEWVLLGINHLELFEQTITAFFNIYDAGITEDYPGFREDVFSTLPLVLMSPGLWRPHTNKATGLNAIHPSFLIWIDGAPNGWDGRSTHSAISAGLFFCLRYLRPDEIPIWFQSLIAIESVYWRSHLLVWLLGIKNLLTEEIITRRKFSKISPRLQWRDSYLLEALSSGNDLFPSANLDAFFTIVKQELDLDTLLQWVTLIPQHPQLQNYLWSVEDLYFDQYFGEE